MNLMQDNWQLSILKPDATIEQAIRNLDQIAIKIVLVTNADDELEGTITDGDIRRGLLKGLDLNSPISSVIHRNALVVPPEMGRDMVLQLMVANKVQQVPVVNEERQVVGLHLWDEITTPVARPNLMVIMVGGRGTRLNPHTENCPKPMLPVAGKPILEHIIDRAKMEGFTEFVLVIQYLGEIIEEYFGDGEKLGVKVHYIREQSPMGTAGGLAVLSPPPELPFVVTNGDIITDIHYSEILDFHIAHKATATMAVRVHEWQHPFGVVQTKGLEIVGFHEKPVTRSHINAGVYVLEPEALTELSANAQCDMPVLFERLQANDKRTLAYPMHEPWLDVGRPEDLVAARLDPSNNRS